MRREWSTPSLLRSRVGSSRASPAIRPPANDVAIEICRAAHRHVTGVRVMRIIGGVCCVGMAQVTECSGRSLGAVV